MEPIKINIEVNLGEATLAALGRLLTAAQNAPVAAQTAPVVETPAPAPKKAKKAKKAAETPQPEPTPAPAPEPVVEEEPVEDLPPDDAPDPAPKKTAAPTEADARQAVKDARSRGVSAKVVRDYMQENFGIASSVECPEERRQELIDGLATLAA